VSNRIFIIAHAPLATALRDCALHVYPECAASVLAVDVLPHEAPEDTLARAQLALKGGVATDGLLVLTDIFGATPANVAQKITGTGPTRLISGVNLPMLYRVVCYREEGLEALVARAISGGTQGVMQVTTTVPQNQQRQPVHDPAHHHHHQ
jgi:PTS system ascorbate-specific IIA component